MGELTLKLKRKNIEKNSYSLSTTVGLKTWKFACTFFVYAKISVRARFEYCYFVQPELLRRMSVPANVPNPPLLCPKNDFLIFMQFLAILRKVSPVIRPIMGNPVYK